MTKRRYEQLNHPTQTNERKTMTRLLLIIIMVTQLGCASIFWETLGGTIIGNIVSEEIRDKLLDKEDDEKEKPPEK